MHFTKIEPGRDLYSSRSSFALDSSNKRHLHSTLVLGLNGMGVIIWIAKRMNVWVLERMAMEMKILL